MMTRYGRYLARLTAQTMALVMVLAVVLIGGSLLPPPYAPV